jgi:hypothetical protein
MQDTRRVPRSSVPRFAALLLFGCACARHEAATATPPWDARAGTVASATAAPGASTPTMPPSPAMNEDAFEKYVVEDFTRPWSMRRGVEASDKGHDAIVLRAAPRDVTGVFSRHGARTVPDALGQEVTLGSAVGFVVQVKGHPWTLVLASAHGGPGIPTPAELSKELDASVLEVVAWEEDIAYSYFEHGTLVEKLEGTAERVTKFESRLRTRADLGTQSPAGIADAFAKAHDAYVGELTADYFFGNGRTVPFLEAGAKLRVNNPGFVLVLGRGREVISRPDIEKLDFLVLRP